MKTQRNGDVIGLFSGDVDIAEIHLGYRDVAKALVMLVDDPALVQEAKRATVPFASERAPRAVASSTEPLIDADVDGWLRKVAVIRRKFTSLIEMAKSVTLEVSAETGMRIECSGLGVNPVGMPYMGFAAFAKTEGWEPVAGAFSFWKAMERPSSDSRSDGLHIVPSYHPSMAGRTHAFLINGATDANIESCYDVPTGLVYVCCPPDAHVGSGVFSTWKTNHPFCAKGTAFAIGFETPFALTEACAASLKKLLRCALGKTDQYVAISGGFDSPYTYPSNLAHLTGREPRGCEDDCVWSYLTLMAEGKLEGSYVPPWFHDEMWLQTYSGEVRRNTPDLAKYLP